METIKILFEEYGWFIGVPAVFLLLVIWIFRPWARKSYDEDGEIPFEDADEDKPGD